MDKKLPRTLAHILPTYANILWIVSFFGVLLLGRGMMNGDGDLGRHLTIGRYILENRRIPLNDLFSHTMLGLSLTPHEWLSQVIFAIADCIFGLDGVIILCAFLITMTFWILFKHVKLLSKYLLISISITLLALASSVVHWLTRPHLFTFLLLTIWMHFLYRSRLEDNKHWWVLPIIMLCWVNLHGAFIAGFVSWILYGLGLVWDAILDKGVKKHQLTTRFWRNYLYGGISSVLMTLLNPSGVKIWETSIGYISNKYLVDFTLEYQSPNFHKITLWPFLIFICLLLIGYGLNNKRGDSPSLFNSIAWLGMSLYSSRNIPLFVIIAAPTLAQCLSNLFGTLSSNLKLFKWFMIFDDRIKNVNLELKGYLWPILSISIAIIGLSLGYRFDYEGIGYDFDPSIFPVEAVNWLEDNPQDGEMFNFFIWGGYMLYRGWPEHLVFIDGQTDFYGEKLTRQYVKVIKLQDNWEEILDDNDVSWVILPSEEKTVYAIQADLGWNKIYEDETTTILSN